MGLANALNRIVIPSAGANDFRLAGQPTFYDVYYLTLNHLPTRTGLWIRYTADRRGPGAAPSEAGLWFHCFRAQSPAESFGMKQKFELPAPATNGVHLRLGEAWFKDGHCVGAMDQDGHRVSWDLTWAPSPTAVWLIPAIARVLRVVPTSLVFPTVDARFSGTVVVDGQELNLVDQPGVQAHTWGPKRARTWAWAHCNAFDDTAPCLVEVGFRQGIPVGAPYLRYRGRDYLCSALPALFSARGSISFPALSFRCRAGGLRFEGRFSAREEAFRQVRFQDGDGEMAWVCNTEIADCQLDVFRGQAHVETLRSTGAAHLEFLSRSQRPEVRISVG